MKTLSTLFLTLFACVAVFASAETVEDRIKPVGSVCKAGAECASATADTGAAAGGARSGEAVYNKACMTCHAAGVAGAPKLGDVPAWAPRIGKGMDALYTSAIKGLNGMPAKGMCFDCSDDELKASVDYMVGKSK